jgi:hypothetical protein
VIIPLTSTRRECLDGGPFGNGDWAVVSLPIRDNESGRVAQPDSWPSLTAKRERIGSRGAGEGSIGGTRIARNRIAQHVQAHGGSRYAQHCDSGRKSSIIDEKLIDVFGAQNPVLFEFCKFVKLRDR